MVSFLALLPANSEKPHYRLKNPQNLFWANSMSNRDNKLWCNTNWKFFFGAKLMRLVLHHPFANEESVNLLPLARTIDFETKPSSITIVNENRFVITGLDVRCKSFSIYFTTDGLYLASTWCLSQKMMDNWWAEFGQMKLSFAENCM